MAVVNPLTFETTGVWLSRQKYEEAESVYQKYLAGGRPASLTASPPKSKTSESKEPARVSGLVSQMESMRTKISDVLNTGAVSVKKSTGGDAMADRIHALENDNRELRKVTSDLQSFVSGLAKRIEVLEDSSVARAAPAAPKTAPVVAHDDDEDDDDDDDDDDIDIFGDVDPVAQEEAKKLQEQRVKEYEERKKKKPAVIAKSNLILDVKPWDDETDMKVVEECVRSIEMDGLLWGASKLVPLAYGIQKLQISCVVEDDKVSTDDLEELITAFEDHIQSMDIAAFNKV